MNKFVFSINLFVVDYLIDVFSEAVLKNKQCCMVKKRVDKLYFIFKQLKL